MALKFNKISAPTNTGGIMWNATDAAPTVDNVNVFDKSGELFARVREGKVFRASWLAVDSTTDYTSVFQTILDHASVGTLLFDDKNYKVNGTLNAGNKRLEFKDNGCIIGTFNIVGGFLKADYHVRCFDVSSGGTFSGLNTVAKRWSARNFGAMADGGDDAPAINAITGMICKDPAVKNNNLYIPPGSYALNSPIFVLNFDSDDNNYKNVTCNIEGASPEKNTTNYTSRFAPTFTETPCIVTQQLKGSVIKNLGFEGGYTKANGYGNIDLINNSKDDWKQTGVSAGRYNPHAAIAIDAFCAASELSFGNRYAGLESYYQGDLSQSGSTQVTIKDCSMFGFYLGVVLSPNNYTLNAEMITVENIDIGRCYSGFVTCQAQSKQNIARNIQVWDRMYSVFNSVDFGSQLGGGGGTEFEIQGMNIAGGVRQILDSRANPYDIQMTGVFAESLWKIGDITGYGTVNIDKSKFDFMNSIADLPTPDSMISGGLTVSVTNSTFRYYTGDYSVTRLNRVNMTGCPAHFENCTFSGYPYTMTFDINTGLFGYLGVYGCSFKKCYIQYGVTNSSVGFGNFGTPLINIPYIFAGAFAERGLNLDNRGYYYNGVRTKIEFNKSAEMLSAVPYGLSNYTYDPSTGNAVATAGFYASQLIAPGDGLFLIKSGSPYRFLGIVQTITDGADGIVLKGGQQGNTNISGGFDVLNNVLIKSYAPLAATVTAGSNVLTNVEYDSTIGAAPGNGFRFDSKAISTQNASTFIDTVNYGAKTITMKGAMDRTVAHATLCNGQPDITYMHSLPPMVFNDNPSGDACIIGGAIWECDGTNSLYPKARYVIRNTTYTGSTLHPFSYGTIDGAPIVTTIAALRTFYGQADLAYYLTDLTLQGMFYYDAYDTTTADDGVDVIVGAGTTRFKRVTPLGA